MPYYFVNTYYESTSNVLAALNPQLSQANINETCSNNFECRHDYIIRINPIASESTASSLNSFQGLANKGSPKGNQPVANGYYTQNITASPPIRVLPRPRTMRERYNLSTVPDRPSVIIFPNPATSLTPLTNNASVADLVRSLHSTVQSVLSKQKSRDARPEMSAVVVYSAQSVSLMTGGVDTNEYASACRLLVSCSRLLYPNITFIWMGSPAVFRNPMNQNVSYTESRRWNRVEQHVMRSLKVPFIPWFRVSHLLRAFLSDQQSGNIEQARLVPRIVQLYMPDAVIL